VKKISREWLCKNRINSKPKSRSIRWHRPNIGFAWTRAVEQTAKLQIKLRRRSVHVNASASRNNSLKHRPNDLVVTLTLCPWQPKTCQLMSDLNYVINKSRMKAQANLQSNADKRRTESERNELKWNELMRLSSVGFVALWATRFHIVQSAQLPDATRNLSKAHETRESL